MCVLFNNSDTLRVPSLSAVLLLLFIGAVHLFCSAVSPSELTSPPLMQTPLEDTGASCRFRATSGARSHGHRGGRGPRLTAPPGWEQSLQLGVTAGSRHPNRVRRQWLLGTHSFCDLEHFSLQATSENILLVSSELCALPALSTPLPGQRP